MLGRRLRLIWMVLAVAALGMAVGAPQALAVAGQITEYPIPILTTPYGITTGPDGKIWFVDSGNHVGGTFIGRMSTTGAIASSDLVAFPGSTLGEAAALGPDGNMWVHQDSVIDEVPIGVNNTSQITAYPLGSNSGGYGSIVPGPDGRMWFGWNHQVGAITTAGVISGYATSSAASIEGVIVGPGGKLWFGEGNKIARMSTSGVTGPSDEFSLPPGDGAINALVLGPDGNVWFTMSSPAAIGRITPAGVITIFPTPSVNSQPFGIAVGPDHKLWFPEENSNKIGSIPTTASSGADITEYPLGGSFAGILYITAGPDNRMWFTEFGRNKLGAITTDSSGPVTPPGSGTPPATQPPSTIPTVLSPPSIALGALPAKPSPVGCVPSKLILTDVFPQAGKTQLLGVAPAAARGKQVTLISAWNGKPVAKPTVQPDLSFSATVPLPPRSLRSSNRARYVAKLGAQHSLVLKFARRMYTTAITAAGRTISFSGTITRPLAKPAQPVVVRASASCSTVASGTVVASVNPSRSGAFTASIQLPAGLQSASAVYLRAQTQVRNVPSNKKTFPTFTLVRGVKLGT